MSRFEGKVAIVTGGAVGIGRATAQRLAAEGARVSIGDRDGEGARKTASEIGENALGLTCDVGIQGDVEHLVDQTVKRFGRLDVLVNNAGTFLLGREVSEIDPKQWDHLIRVNLTGPFYACRAAIPHMKAQGGGAIVNIGSVSGMRGDRGFSPFSASKAGLLNFTRTLAIDHGRDGIRVNAVCPGATLSETGQNMLKPEIKAVMLPPIPLGRYAECEEQAAAITFLASDEASYITGAVLPVDGGVTSSVGQGEVGHLVRDLKGHGEKGD